MTIFCIIFQNNVLLFLIILLSNVSSQTATSLLLTSFDLSKYDWILSNCDGTLSLPATIPGLVHIDLLNAGK